MFTGIIEDIGTVVSKQSRGKEFSFAIQSSIICSDCHIGDSINVNGVCQTVTNIAGDIFTVDTVEETLRKTNIGDFNNGSKVNLERAMPANGRFGGHFVLGHVDTVGNILKIEQLISSYTIELSYPHEFSDFLVETGSICIDGISLTIASLMDNKLRLAIIPHTWLTTILSRKKRGDSVNLEFDVFGKYIAKILGTSGKSKITPDWLKEHGF